MFAIYADRTVEGDDIMVESVLVSEYADQGIAVDAARRVSDREHTVATVYDLNRPSAITSGPTLVAAFEDGYPL